MCPSKTYAITPEKAVAASAALLAATGVNIDATAAAGEVSVHSVDLTWTNRNDELTVNVVSKPFYVTCSEIFDPLDKYFA
jgi:hypothetical protein